MANRNRGGGSRQGVDLQNDGIGGLMLKLALPAIAAQVINALYNIVDRIFIGNLPGAEGTNSIAALGVCFPLVIVISAFGTLVGVGGSSLAAIRMGEGRRETAERILSNCLPLLVAFTAVIVPVCLLFGRDLLLLVGATFGEGIVKNKVLEFFGEGIKNLSIDFRLGIDTRQADQQLRGTVSLPNGSGKTVRVAVFAEGAAAQAAEEAGADIVGTDELMQQIQAGEFNFDAAVATPDQMGKVGRLGKILGPRGLMPNPKLGTVTNDVAKAIKELKGGRVEYRADRYGIAHVVLGKVSFTPEQLAENYGAVYDEILRMKPAAAKGKYVKSITVSGTMTPGVSVDSSVTRAYTESAE